MFVFLIYLLVLSKKSLFNIGGYCQLICCEQTNGGVALFLVKTLS